MNSARARVKVLALAGALAAILSLAAGTGRAVACPWVGSTDPIEDRVSQVLARMSIADEIGLVHGITEPQQFIGFPGAPPYTGVVAANPRVCIPELHLQDGPAGVGDGLTRVTQLPAPVAAAASWDTSLMRSYGALIGEEQRGKGVDVTLAPTINIVRDPRWGRAFESFGEDPYLTGRLAVSNIAGIQGQGILAQVKHFAVYNQEFLRDTPLDDAIVSERVMHEIYLPGFEAAVREADVASVMCSYNYVNFTPACAHPYLLGQVLKGEFGFQGFVTSDWFAMTSSAAAADAGLDMQMPDHCLFGKQLQANVTSGLVPKARLDDMVRRILREMFRFGLFDRPRTGSPTATVTTAAHAAFARHVAEDGTVLLKNAGGILPIRTGRVRSMAVIGRDAGGKTMSSGGGSSEVVAPYVSTPLAGITRRAGAGVRVSYDNGQTLAGAASVARSADIAVVFASLHQTESGDLRTIELAGTQNAVIEAVAQANPNTIVVLHTGSAVTMPWLSKVKAVLEAWYPGQENGNAIAAVLFGDAEPSGRLPVTFPTDLTQVPANDPTRWPGVGVTRYAEGLQVGYRWYDAHGLTPLFPFGFGLSYTTFALSDLALSPSATGTGDVTATVIVTNTGPRAGSQVVQLYLGAPSVAQEPPRQLKGFQKVRLASGESRTLTFSLDARSLSYWKADARRWVAPAGSFDVFVGTSSRDLPLRGSFTLNRTIFTSDPTPAAPPIPAPPPTSLLVDAASCPQDIVAATVAGGLSVVGFLP